MKRRIMSLAICVVMLASAFTMAACSGGGSDDLLKVVYGNEGGSAINKTPMTITIYTITDGSTTDQAIKDVEAALSEISEKKYNTKIDLILLPEETYASVMFNKLDSSIAAYHQYIALNQKPITYEDKELNKNPGISSLDGINVASKIPAEVNNANIDIFLVYNPQEGSPTLDPESEYYNPVLKDNGMFNLLYNVRALAELDADKKITNGTFSALKTIAPERAINFVTKVNYLGMIKGDAMSDSNKQIFGIPNNYVYGSYDFVMFNVSKDAAGNDIGINKVYPVDDKSGIVSEEGLKQAVAELERMIAQRLSQVLAINNIEPEMNPNWSDEMKADWQERYSKAKADVCQEILGVRNIEKTFTSYEEYLESGDDTFAIGYISGEYSLKQLFEENGVLDVYAKKTNYVTDKNATESMFCVNPGCLYYMNEDGKEIYDKTRLTRALEVLMLINNNAEFRNTLQYGVKDKHYTKLLDNTISVTGTDEDRYLMFPQWTGNMYILEPADTMSRAMQLMAQDEWRLAKIQANETLKKQEESK